MGNSTDMALSCSQMERNLLGISKKVEFQGKEHSLARRIRSSLGTGRIIVSLNGYELHLLSF